MLTFLFVAAVIGFFVWLRVKKKTTSATKPSGPLPTALDLSLIHISEPTRPY